MASSILGKTIDIHCGGIDNMFPHHENEIAQCEACYKMPFSKYWLHSQHLLVEGKKMSKSLGNFFTLRDLINKGYTARAIRYVLLSGHYKMPLNFTFEGLDAAKGALARIDSVIDRLERQNHTSSDKSLDLSVYTKQFDDALLDDLNTPQALSALFEMIRTVNAFIDKQGLSRDEGQRILEIFKNFDKVLAVIFHTEETVPDFILALAEKRKEAKKAKNFQESDRLRDELKELGFLVEDTPAGFRVTKL
jgi:cysteinyl-tRNA synthetase